MMDIRQIVDGVEIKGRMKPGFERVLTADALGFLAGLEREFGARRRQLLALRAERQKAFDAGALPDFLPQTEAVRSGDWNIAPIPPDLLDRRVEITGPSDSRKMVINALNSGAQSYMTDFEDAIAPTWDSVIAGQLHLMNYWRGQLDFVDDVSGKAYEIAVRPAVLIARPRGWHLEEAHIEIDGRRVSGALADFAFYVFHNRTHQKTAGTGPYFYLPKIESHLEARLWNDVFVWAQNALGMAQATIKATVLIETLSAAFEMDEILYELRDHIVGLNCGRWDYIFSYIKKLAQNPAFLLPNREQIVMGKAFLNAYSLLLIRTCHARGAFAMGGMAAQIPVKGDPALNAAAFERVRVDETREVDNGHDGTWVAHPDLVAVAFDAFGCLDGPNQLTQLRKEVRARQSELLEPHLGTRTEKGVRECCRVAALQAERMCVS